MGRGTTNAVDFAGWLEDLADGPRASCFAAAILNTEPLVLPPPRLVQISMRSSAEGRRRGVADDRRDAAGAD